MPHTTKKKRTLSGAPTVSTPGTDRAAAASQRELMRQAREQEEREAKIRRGIGLGILGVVVVALATILAVVVVPALNKKAAATGSYALAIGSESAPVTVDIYQDFMCPYCGQFERAQSTDLKAMVDAGQVKVVFHLMNFLDSSSSGTKYSTRAADAFATVAKQQPSAALAFDSALYAQQPAEGSGGLTDAQIADLARSAGVSDGVIATFANKPNLDFVNKSNQAAFADGITSTPTVKINGTVFKGDLYTAGTLKTAVEAAK
ncbi:MAG TPA: thioredoxin domain-containing protein [Propionibacteriaceae bacterium]|nr:thioredoxin domain-containing protein [Propionibacteriaceae bacterium]